MNDRCCRGACGLLVRACVLIALVGTTGCQTLREVSNLRKVDFSIDRVSSPTLAGVNLRDVRSYSDLGARDMLRLSSAIADGTMPLSFTLHLNARNPASNDVNARLTKMDWTLLLQDRETISGTFNRETVLRPGEPTDVPIDLRLNLVEFFDDNLRDVVNLALSLRGEQAATNVKMQVRPTVRTALGPIAYPGTITVVNQDVGQREGAR